MNTVFVLLTSLHEENTGKAIVLTQKNKLYFASVFFIEQAT